MSTYHTPVQNLAEQFRKLSGIGAKTAQRLAYEVLEMSKEDVQAFAGALLYAKEHIATCQICFGLSGQKDMCEIRADERRDHSRICVVEQPQDIVSFERIRDYKGLSHVLHGVISPMDGIGPEHLKIKELISRAGADGVEEIILATNPTIEGEMTATYIHKLLKVLDVKVTRIAYGIPVGGDIEYADEITLYRAMEGRRNFN
jgi:recombination protein RecR